MSADIDALGARAGQRVDDPAARASAEREGLTRLVSEFESSLMMQLIQEMRHAAQWDDESEDGGQGETQSLFEMLDAELAAQMTRSNGLGLTPQLTRPPDRTGERSRAEIPGADPSIVTSGFGWRTDPLSGAKAFHQGIDIRAAYGQDVAAVAPGRIASAGTQGGYGTTVVVEHPDGTRTRYAHLSVALVREGDEVAGGQVIGRAGNSGRATGPHLHFEVLDRDGVAVDPGEKARR